MRKFVVLLMCFILPFSLFAQGAAESGAADDQGKVIIFQSKVEITEALEDAAADFTEETGIEVEIWETTGDDYRAQLSLRLAGDEVPTIFTVAAGSEAEMFAPYIAPIEDSEVNQYISPSLALMVNGKSSGVPYSVEGYGLVINTDMVSEADLENDETFLTALDRLASEGVNPFGLSQESYFLIGHLLNAPFAIMEDPEGFLADFEAGNVHLADQEEFQAFAALMDKIKEVAVNPLEVNYDRECGDFATGKTAMIHQGNWCYSMFSSYLMIPMSIWPLLVYLCLAMTDFLFLFLTTGSSIHRYRKRTDRQVSVSLTGCTPRRPVWIIFSMSSSSFQLYPTSRQTALIHSVQMSPRLQAVEKLLSGQQICGQ